MKDTAVLFIIACVFIALVVTQTAISTSDTISVTIRENENSFDSEVYETSSTVKIELININTATEDLLCNLVGIGEVKAESIVHYREEHGPFTSVEDLLNVHGIGQATLEKLRPYITV